MTASFLLIAMSCSCLGFIVGVWIYRYSTLAQEKKREIEFQILGNRQTLKNSMGHFFSTWTTRLMFLEKNIFLGKYLSYLKIFLSRAKEMEKPMDLLLRQVIWAVAALLGGILTSNSFQLSLIAMIGAFSYPLLKIRDKAIKREQGILRELPNALEALALCSEAGLSFEQGIEQYIRNAKDGPLKEEFGGFLEQTRVGSNRKTALEVIANRLNLTDFSLFTTSVIHAERFGTGISKTLGQLSLTMRDKQYQRAEKAIQEMPVKLLLPLILCIMPVTFLMIFGPLMIQFLNQ